MEEAIWVPVMVADVMSAATINELVQVWVEPAKWHSPIPGDDALTSLAATNPLSAGMLDAPKLTRCPLVPAKAVPLISLALFTPVPLKERLPPLPTTIVAVVFVPPVIDPKPTPEATPMALQVFVAVQR
jgi:hypothetical protein